MFCPKCKYTTFDFYKNCPKCNFEWDSIRKELGIEWMMEPDVVTSVAQEEVESEETLPLTKEEMVNIEGDVLETKEEITMEVPVDILTKEKEEEEEIGLEPPLMMDSEEPEESIKVEPELIEPEIEIKQEPEIEVIPLEKEEKQDSEVWDIEFEETGKDKKIIESKAPVSEKDTESLLPEIDLELLIDEEDKQSKN